MKRAAFILALMFPATAAADKTDKTIPVTGWIVPKLEKPKLKFQKKKLWNLAALPAYFFLETTIHEGSHAVAAIFNGYHVSAFKPYPHVASGQLLWGAFYLKDKWYSKSSEAVIAAAPYFTDLIIFTSTDLLLGYRLIPPESVAGLIVYTVGMVAPWINFVYNVNNTNPLNDFSCISRAIGINRWAVLAVGDVIAAIALWRLWVRGRDVLFSAAPTKEKPSRITFVPLMGSVNGAMMGTKF